MYAANFVCEYPPSKRLFGTRSFHSGAGFDGLSDCFTAAKSIFTRAGSCGVWKRILDGASGSPHV